MNNKIKLFRICFRHHDFNNEKENEFLYYYQQISFFLITELNPYLNKKIKHLIINFGTEKIWSKFYKNDPLPILHWYRNVGEFSGLFDYDHFNQLENSAKLQYVLIETCHALEQLAKLSNREDFHKAVKNVFLKVKDLKKINFSYIVFKKDLEIAGVEYKSLVKFVFEDKIKIFLEFKLISGKTKSFLISTYKYGYIEWLVTAWKNIVVKDNVLIVSGSRELDELPFKISLDELRKDN